ncbi:MAG: TetR/AcrR family transcriptional regulator [Fusobacteriaceae bacterium]|nr:TetR/AcrR family transcriptional regulator [Fusobacteriaceae bacterium]
MQYKKDNIKENILVISKNEFLEKDFSRTSIRNIALKSKVSSSNIYNYFKNKNEIFEEIISPTLVYFDNIFSSRNIKECENIKNPKDLEWHIEFISMIYTLSILHKENLILIFKKSKGSKFENFKEEIVNKYLDFYSSSEKINKNISNFFMYNFTMFYVNYLENLCTNSFNDNEVKKLLLEMIFYSHNGFNSLLNEKDYYIDDLINSIKLLP